MFLIETLVGGAGDLEGAFFLFRFLFKGEWIESPGFERTGCPRLPCKIRLQRNMKRSDGPSLFWYVLEANYFGEAQRSS